MRVLHLTTEFPWPATSGGSVRTVSQLRILASLPEVEQVTVLSVTEREVPDSDRRALAAAIPKLRVAPPVFHPVHLFDFESYVPRVVALRALAGVPYLAAKWDSPKLRTALRHSLIDSAFDVVYVDHLGMARYLPDVAAERASCRIVLDQHNVESDFFKQFADRQKGPKRLVAQAEVRASVNFEKNALKAAQAVVAILYELRKLWLTRAGMGPTPELPATFESQDRMFKHLAEALTSQRFLWDFRGGGIFHVLRTVIARGLPTQKEIKVFHGLATQLQFIADTYKVPHPRDVPKTLYGERPPEA